MGDTVLFISLPTLAGGSLRSLAMVLDRFEGRCTRVVATPLDSWFGRQVIEHDLADELIPIPSIDSSRWSRPLAAARLAAWSMRHRSDLVALHANGLPELNLAMPAALITRRPVVVWAHDYGITPWSRRLVPLVSRVTHADVLPVTTAAAFALTRAGLVNPGRVTVVPNPIDPDEVCATRRPESGVVRVGYLGAPAHYKGFHLLPAIARGLAGEGVRLLVFVSPPDRVPGIREELQAITDPEVEFMGARADVREAYADCDIVLCPSLEESFGRVAAEAMANGIPVVASDIGALREVVGEAGLLFPPGDAAAAADAVRRLVHDEALRAELGQAGHASSARYEPAPIMDQLARFYRLDA
jgi:glycosyltransferase involved in cell wall biosynthesis